MGPKSTITIAALLLLWVSQGPAAEAPARSELRRKLQPCQVAGGVDSVLCGSFEVPEVRGAAGSRRLALHVVLLPATTDSVFSDPLVFLAGGGVVPATRYAGFLSRAFPTLRRHRDILLVDQRGTWNSNPLSCEPAAGPAPGRVAGIMDPRDCLSMLMQRADLRAYSTAIAMDDLDAVRDWLGYPTVNLYGVSYGTKAAQVYLKQYPDHVRSAVLYGVVPLAARSQLDLATFAQKSLERVFALCGADASCHAAFPNLDAEFDSVLIRLSRTPARVRAPATTGEAQSVQVTDRMFRDLVQTRLGSARGIERLPQLIHAAYSGDYGPVAAAVLGDGPPPQPPAPPGVFFSILCSESIPLIDPSSIPRATAGTFFGDGPVRSQIDICAEWPRAVLPRDFWEPVCADVPVLAITGDLDPITPPSYGEMVIQHLSNARHIVVPNRSHGDVDSCITSLFERFLSAGRFDGLDTTCVTSPMPIHFATPGSGEPQR